MRVRRMGRSFRLAFVGLGGGCLWILAWGSAAQVGFSFRPLPALAYMATAAAVFMLYLARLPSLRRRRWAATIGVRRFGAGTPWFLVALPAATLTTLLLATLHLRFLPGYGGAPQVDYAYRSLPLGQLVVPFTAILFMPLIEETGVRGLMQGTMARGFGPVIAASIAAVPWALGHLAPPLLLYYFAGGLLNSYARVATRSIWAPVMLHMADNAVLSGAPVVLGAFAAWGADAPLSVLLAALLAAAALAVVALRATGTSARARRSPVLPSMPSALAGLRFLRKEQKEVKHV